MPRSESDLLGRRLSSALEALLQRTNDDRFVVFSDQRSDKFVQFADGHRGLLLDLPEQQLDLDEWRRAKHFFRQFGVTPQPLQGYSDEAMTKPACMMSSFQMEFQKDVYGATRVALEIFDQVYMLPHDFQLLIKEN